MPITTEFRLPLLTPWKKSRMLRFATKLLEAQHQMTGMNGKNILHYTLKKNRQHLRMNHYPKGDRIDYTTGAQYFYHCHRENLDSTEHGHFHCFLRNKSVPKNLKPTTLPDSENNATSPMTHLIAISMNRYGQPIRLFTVNRWVSSEIWYDAKHTPGFIRRFKMTLADDPYWQILDQWVEGMLHLFAPQIAWLHELRDLNVAEQRAIPGKNNIYEDRSVEELSEISIDLTTQIQWVLG